MKVAIQGGQASFHHAAALLYFPNQSVELIECNLFSQVCDALAGGQADYGAMAIENTLAGSILPNYLLLMEYALHVVGEVHMRIDQNLMALPGQQIEDIRVVRSHPMALLQCSEFLRAHRHLVPQEAFDTADSAKEIRSRDLKGVGAIAGRLAAELYGLEILAANIENKKANYTRFLILSRQELPRDVSVDKATITFSIRHECGALVDILGVFKDLNCNLTLIQSVPLADKPYEYSFCVDYEFPDQAALQESLRRIRSIAYELNLIGTYKRGDKLHLYARP